MDNPKGNKVIPVVVALYEHHDGTQLFGTGFTECAAFEQLAQFYDDAIGDNALSLEHIQFFDATPFEVTLEKKVIITRK